MDTHTCARAHTHTRTRTHTHTHTHTYNATETEKNQKKEEYLDFYWESTESHLADCTVYHLVVHYKV